MDVRSRIASAESDYITVGWEEGNPLKAWWRIRNPLRIFWNFFIIKVTSYAPERVKNFCLRYFLGVTIGERSAIAPGTELDYFYPELIEIGEDVIIGEKAKLLTHEFQQDQLRFGTVTIKDGCTVGAFAIVRSGVTIHERSRAGFGCVVHESIGPDETVVGAPMERL